MTSKESLTRIENNLDKEGLEYVLRAIGIFMIFGIIFLIICFLTIYIK